MGRTSIYPEGSEQVTLILPRGLKARVKGVAEQRRQSTSALIAVAIEEWLDQQRQEKQTA
jgi:predicted transcriptional regulator